MTLNMAVPSKTKIDKYSITFIGRFVQTGGAKKEHNIKVETADKTRHGARRGNKFERGF